MLLKRVLAAIWYGEALQRLNKVAESDQVKVGPEELLNGESLTAVEAAASLFSCVPR